jgi:hypothetical protein
MKKDFALWNWVVGYFFYNIADFQSSISCKYYFNLTHKVCLTDTASVLEKNNNVYFLVYVYYLMHW